MEADSGIEIVVVAARGVNWFGTPYFLRRLAHQLETAGNVVTDHRLLGGEKADQGGDAQCRMRVGMAPGIGTEAVAGPRHDIGRLTIAGNAVIFGVSADGRTFPVLPGCAERGRHAAAAWLDLK